MQLKDYTSRCEICLAFRENPGKEPLKQHEFPARLWSKVGSIDLHVWTPFVVIDHYSNFIEVEQVTNLTTQGVTKVLKEMFARYGPLDQVMSDNWPQFLSTSFKEFAAE